MKLVCVASAVVLLSTGLAAQGSGKGNTKPQSAIAIVVDGLTCTTPSGGGAFAIHAWSWGASNSVDLSGGGGGAGKVSISDLSVTKAFDACSPALFGGVATGKHFKNLTLTQSNSDGTLTTLTLDDVLVSSWQASGSTASEGASESVSFAFSKVCLTDGGTGAKFCYDLKAAKTF